VTVGDPNNVARLASFLLLYSLPRGEILQSSFYLNKISDPTPEPKYSTIAPGAACVSFCREMHSDNHNAPCFSPMGFVWLSVFERGHQASRLSSQHSDSTPSSQSCREICFCSACAPANSSCISCYHSFISWTACFCVELRSGAVTT